MSRPALAAAVLAAALTAALPPAARASQITVAEACAVADSHVNVTGSGFSAGAPVTLSGDATGTATADGGGAFATQLPAPGFGGVGPRTASISAQDGNPATAASATFQVIKELFWGNYENVLKGPPAERTFWRLVGFTPGMTVYGHFRFRGRTRRDFRFGVATGPCGVLERHARRVPVYVPYAGTWTLQMDQQPSFDRATRPRRLLFFQIYPTKRGG